MKTDLNELNFVSRFLDKIRRGVVDSGMQSLIKKNPELAKKTIEFNKANKDYADFLNRFAQKNKDIGKRK
tara:strand:- start:302 stop:511 length:210 start_codon:yes stop_codon:yes gene_type:complete